MKKIDKSALLYNFVVAILLGSIVAAGCVEAGAEVSQACITGEVVSIGVFSLGFLSETRPTGVLRNEVIKTIFSSDIQKNLYPDNEFYKSSKVDPGVAIDAESVDVPQAGTPPKVIKNPVERPIPMRIRKDDKKSYGVDLYETEPDLITNVNAALLPYNKRQVITEDHVNTLNLRIADELQIIWSPSLADNILRTTGANGTGSKISGMTGSRKEVTEDDFISIAALLDRMGVPDDGKRVMLIYTDIYSEIKRIASFKDFDKTGLVGTFQTGAIGKIQNMNVFKRNVPLNWNNAGTPAVKAYGSAVSATDNLAILAWHPSFVRRAEGIVEYYIDSEVRPGQGGRAQSAAVRGGGMISRKDEKGVVALVQATV